MVAHTPATVQGGRSHPRPRQGRFGWHPQDGVRRAAAARQHSSPHWRQHAPYSRSTCVWGCSVRKTAVSLRAMMTYAWSQISAGYVKRWRPRGTAAPAMRAIPAPENDPHHRRVEPLISVPCDWLRRLAARSCLHFDGPCVSPPSHPLPDDVNLASVRRRPSAWLRR
jgi:hypothetical protein